MPRRKRLALTLYASLAIATTGLVLVLWAFSVFRGSDLETVDARYVVRGTHAAPDVIVVGIDPRTLKEIGRFPFSRTHHARVIRRLVGAGAGVIAYDVQFTERSGNDAADIALVEAADTAPRIVLGTSEVRVDGATRIFGGGSILKEIGAQPASVNVPNDPGGVIRRFDYDFSHLESLPVRAAQLARGTGVVRRSDFRGDGTQWIDFPGPPGTVRTVSFVDVEKGRIDAAVFRGKIVFVGATTQ